MDNPRQCGAIKGPKKNKMDTLEKLESISKSFLISPPLPSEEDVRNAEIELGVSSKYFLHQSKFRKNVLCR